MFGRTGRRTTLLLGPVFLASCALLTAFGSTAQSLYLARLLGGAGHGVGVSFNSIYAAEVRNRVEERDFLLCQNKYFPLS